MGFPSFQGPGRPALAGPASLEELDFNAVGDAADGGPPDVALTALRHLLSDGGGSKHQERGER
jgi:hypothetical protein